jgi:phosphoglycerate dehydrogenase-like enzyme
MDRSPQPAFEAETGARRATMDELLRDSDVVSVHVPLSGETKGLLNSHRFLVDLMAPLP